MDPAAPRSVEEDPSSRMRQAQLRAYLSLPATQKRIFDLVSAFVGAKTPASVKQDIAQEANLAAFTAKSLPRSEKTMPGWLSTVTRRAVCHHFRRSKADLVWLDREQEVEELSGEALEPADDAWLIAGWLASEVASNERDQQTYEMIRYKARTGKTDAQVAEDHGITYAAWTHRLSRFKGKYAARYRKRKLLFLLLLGGLAAALLLAAWLLARAARPDIGPDRAPVRLPPRPSASAPSTPPSERPFEPANPTTPTRPAPLPDNKLPDPGQRTP